VLSLASRLNKFLVVNPLNSLFRLLQRDVVSSYLDSGSSVDEQGVEDAFELLHEMSERVRTGVWVGDCFIYTNSSWRLNYCVGGEVLSHFPFSFKELIFIYLLNSW
jgi:coatomer subunit beta'